MKTGRPFLTLLTCLMMTLIAGESHASDEDLFSVTVPPDALIVLDLSGSMNWDPAGNPTSPPNRRIDIAKSVIHDLLDDDDDGRIDREDETRLNVRLGYMRFRNITAYDNDDGQPFTGNIKVFKDETEIGAPYSTIWAKVSDRRETAVGCTPLGATLAEGTKYFTESVNPTDPAIACRLKYIIFVTDGSDTVGCNGDCSEEAHDMWRRRMLTVQRAKEAFEAGIQVFAVGFGGDMPDHLKTTLNWMAKYGGSDNPLVDNSGDPTAYDIKKYIPKDQNGKDLDACSTREELKGEADPANYPLSGYAFLANNASELSQALKAVLKYVRSQPYYMASPTVPSFRLSDQEGEDHVIYISSFVPNNTPFWEGRLRKYRANPDGTVPVDQTGKPLQSNLIWDASEELKDVNPNSRNILTYVNGAMRSFNSANLRNSDLEVDSDRDREDLINYVRRQKLGDIFHSNGVIVGSPSRFFEEMGFSGPGGFYERNRNRTKVIIVGANDGMLHAFNAQTGREEWAFIPNSLLKRLKRMRTAHTYYVDGSPRVADVWDYTIARDRSGRMKNPNEWKTVLVCGLRKGGKHYFALDITDTLNPKYLWEFPKDSGLLSRLGESWSDPAIGRVKIEQAGGLVERWVAFIGGGFDPKDKEMNKKATIGNAFFVIDIMTGEIIIEFSAEKFPVNRFPEFVFMRHSFPAPPTTFDTNSDGFVDKVYIGDLGGQMWVFDVAFDGINLKSESRWNGRRLFQAPAEAAEKHNIYYPPAVAFDRYRIPWVYFGTGNREDPKDASNQNERFYAVMDDGKGGYPREEKDLRDVTNLYTFRPDRTKKGWFIKLEKEDKRLEKVLGRPTVFNRLLYFTTYIYDEQSDPCQVGGESRLYVVEYLSGGGAFELADYLLGKSPERRWGRIGSGVASSPIITLNVTGQGSVVVGTMSGQVHSAKAHSPLAFKETLYWREVIP